MATGSLAEEMARKKEIKSAKKLYEKSGQAPSPSKDYCYLVVTTKGMVYSRLIITLRNRAQGWCPRPQEVVMSHEDFGFDKSFQSELEAVFGSKSMKHIKRIVSGCHDVFICLPEDLTVRVILYLDLQSIARLSQTSQHFRELCNSDELWKQLYVLHQGQPSTDIQVIAKEIGWKKLFFTNKLQIQKEVSRLRRKNDPNSSPNPVSTGEVTFLTQQVED